MAPSKPRHYDDPKGDGHKEKVIKKRSHKETPILPPPSKAPTPEKTQPKTDFTKFDRASLENYRRHYSLDTPATYLYSSYHYWMAVPGSIGMMSPTMVAARKRKTKIQHPTQRQTREELANAAQKHFDSMAINETDVIVDFISTLRQQGTRPEMATFASDESLII